jgi:hypothetical protein
MQMKDHRRMMLFNHTGYYVDYLNQDIELHIDDFELLLIIYISERFRN